MSYEEYDDNYNDYGGYDEQRPGYNGARNGEEFQDRTKPQPLFSVRPNMPPFGAPRGNKFCKNRFKKIRNAATRPANGISTTTWNANGRPTETVVRWYETAVSPATTSKSSRKIKKGTIFYNYLRSNLLLACWRTGR